MPPKRRGVRVTVYLPDELRQQARSAGLNLSRILRDGVERELRGDAPSPAVEVERVGGSVELRISVPVDLLRKQTH
jgi:Post-segregation antitoxin CcdA